MIIKTVMMMTMMRMNMMKNRNVPKSTKKKKKQKVPKQKVAVCELTLLWPIITVKAPEGANASYEDEGDDH